MSSTLFRLIHARWPFAVVVMLAAAAVSAQAAEEQGPPAKASAKAAPAALVPAKNSADTSDEAAIRAAESAFVQAFNRGDAKAVAALWTANGSLADDQGRVFKGRKAIEDEYAAFFKGHPGAKMEVAIQSIDFPAPGSAVEDGVARVLARNDAPPVASRYTAFHVRVDGKWRMASVRESGIELPSNYGRLQDFEWLVGKWETRSEAATVRTTVRWMANRSFLQREYTVRKGGVTDSSGIQIIGWDPRAGQVRSWSFDSSGGYGTGLWTPVPEGWRIESQGVLADGISTTSQDFLIRVPGEDDVLGWRSLNRKVGDRPLPDLREVVLERLPEKQTHD
jgi:uncharacterized protein (TIGR02246 family)